MDVLMSSPPHPTAPANARRDSSPRVSSNPASPSHSQRAPASASVADSGVNSRPANHSASQDDQQLHNSQESIISNLSFSSKPPGLFSSSSNVSATTVQTVDTDLTAPTSPEQLNSLAKKAIELQYVQSQRPHTPGVANGSMGGGSGQVSSASTSPMSIDTPYVNKGSKRTASGAIKSAISIETSVGSIPANDAVDSPVGRSPREVAQTLRTRLSYAMLKVQNGWEHRTLDELESMTERSMPSTPARSRAGTTTSRRLSMLSQSSEPYLQSPAAAEFPHGMPRLLQDLSSIDYKYRSTVPVSRTANGRSLEPAAPISSRSNRRSISTKPPPMLSTADIPRSSAEYPTTPQRHGILRMPSKQDEKDAVDTLVFMSSPSNSNNMRYAGSAQASPLRTEFPGTSTDYAGAGKKVVFNDRHGGPLSQAPR